MDCDVCGQDLRGEEGIVIGKKVYLLGANPARKRVEEVFGKNKFNICYVCLLKSLGVKEVESAKLDNLSQ